MLRFIYHVCIGLKWHLRPECRTERLPEYPHGLAGPLALLPCLLQALQSSGFRVTFEDIPDTDHFSIIERLVEPDYRLTQVCHLSPEPLIGPVCWFPDL